MKELISKKILIYNPETSKYESVDAIRGESAYEVALRTGVTSLPEKEWIEKVESGQINGDYIKTVNSQKPDSNGNVNVTVNGQGPDESGDIVISTGNPDVITTMTKAEFDALTSDQIGALYEDGVRTILVEDEGQSLPFEITWNDIQNKPDVYPPSTHTHTAEDIGARPNTWMPTAANVGALPADGTAVNADKLGNKPPEYYLTPVNLLRNGDFLNPINSRGVTANTGHWDYVLDCWHCESDNYTPDTVLISNGGVTLAPTADYYCGIQQQFERYSELAGKVCTAAICSNNTWYVANFSIGATSDLGILLENGLYVYSLSTHHFLIRNIAGNSAVTIQRVALYEGTYTADSLPPYVPTHPRVESLKLGNPVQPVNLLDNSWFGGRYVDGVKEGLVYQAGLNGTHGTTKYPMDRWISWNLDATFADGYIIINSPYDQKIDSNKIDPNKTYTAAVCFADGTITCGSGTFANGFGSYASWGFNCSTNSAGVKSIRLWNNQAFSIRWVALYEGAYTTETLPPYVPKPYAVELAECQRYYLPVVTNPVGFGYAFSSGDVVIVNIPLPQPMRAVPSLPIGIVFTVKTVAGDSLSTSTYTVFKMAGNGLQVNLSGVTVPAGQPCTVAATDFSLNLDL